MSLDDVSQAPGGPERDTSGGFADGGWTSPHSEAVSRTAMSELMNKASDLLLGRKTFDDCAKFWPRHIAVWPGVKTATKYIASKALVASQWKASVFLGRDLGETISKRKRQEGPDSHISGIANLVPAPLPQDLTDALRRKIFR